MGGGGRRGDVGGRDGGREGVEVWVGSRRKGRREGDWREKSEREGGGGEIEQRECVNKERSGSGRKEGLREGEEN